MKKIIKFIIYFLKKNLKESEFVKHKSWESAKQSSVGYDSNSVLKKVRESAKLVHSGKAVYERDSVIFDKIQYSWPLLSSLMLVAANNKSLKVIDFGGSFGTTFQQNKKFLKSLPFEVDWRIIEQPKIVEIGKKEFTTKNLTFYNDLKAANKNGADVILFGSSVCYIENCYKYLNLAAKLNPSFIIFDRTPINNEVNDTFSVQNVSSKINNASLPIRNFSFDNLIKPFNKNYKLIEKWICTNQPDTSTTSMGLILKNKKL